jgi:enterobacterial common antigen flippase
MSELNSMMKSALRSGAAGMVNLVIGLVRMKIYSLLLGPSQLGYSGLLTSYVHVAGSCATLGLGSTSTTQIAGSGLVEQAKLQLVRAITICAIALGALACVISILFSGFLSSHLKIVHLDLWIVAIGIFFQCLATALTGCMFGMNRIGQFAAFSIATSVLGSLLAVFFIWAYAAQGVAWSVATLPATTALALFGYILWLTHVPNQSNVRSAAIEYYEQLKHMLRLGLPLVFIILVQLGAALVIRAWLFAFSGQEQSGFFHAAFTLASAMTTLSLSAFDSDLLRRLSAAKTNRTNISIIMQSQVLVVGALLASMASVGIGFAEVGVHILLSSAFIPAIPVLKLLCLSEFLRGLAYAYGKVPLAFGRTTLGFSMELAAAAVLFGVGYLLIPTMGAIGAAYAFTASRLFLLILSMVVSAYVSGAVVSKTGCFQISLIVALLTLLVWCSSVRPIAGYFLAIAVVSASATMLWHRRRLSVL